MEMNQDNKHLLHKLSNSIRILAADAVEKASSGHPGMPLGFASIFTVLAFNFLRFDRSMPKWPERDRLVLSAGHGSMLLYAFYYLAGFKDFTLEDIKFFRQFESKTPGHPEYGIYEFIETTTGPLGQGFATSVGMAVAAKKSLRDNKIYTIVGDGCLMEGISYEAASLAGHLSLDNIIVLFDNNNITIDGATNLAVSEDHLKKFQSLGWNVEEIDGNDFDKINAALTRAQSSTKPYFISCRTIIGYGANNKRGSEKSHGSPLGSDEIEYLKEYLEWNKEPFSIPKEIIDLWRNIDSTRGKTPYQNSDTAMEKAVNIYKLNVQSLANDESTRGAAGRIISELLKYNPKIIAGSADLSISNNLKSENCKMITKDDFSGNFIHYGIREHAMAAIMNGLALEGFLPIGGTFLVFSDYMRPSIRLSAIMKLKVIYIMTHDSIGVGEDGPTHQPIEHLSSLRAIPDLQVFRPADFVETLESLDIATASNIPSVISLTRQNLPKINEARSINLTKLGAYILKNSPKPDVTIFASGSEVHIALEVSNILEEYDIRVVSVPSFELFFSNNDEYVNSLLEGNEIKVAIEAGSSLSWYKMIGRNGMFFCIDEFGKSAPYKDLYNFFGINAKQIAVKIKDRLEMRKDS